MSNIRQTPERNAPDPILPEPIGEDGLVQPDDGATPDQTVTGLGDDGLGPADEDEDQPGLPSDPPMERTAEDHRTPGDQRRPMTAEERLDEALEETFPTSDPIAPSRIDGPGN